MKAKILSFMWGCAFLIGSSQVLLAAPTDASEDSVLATLGDIAIQGGWLMIPIGLASILMVGVTIERLFSLRRGSVCPKGLWDEIRNKIKGGKVAEAQKQLEGNQVPLARMLYAGVERWDEELPEMAIALEDSGQRQADDLQKHLPALQGIASVAPLLGLLGTVVGMIQAFLLVAKEQALGNNELLAEGIGMALSTTAAGLSVAIPALILFYYFRGRIRSLVRDFDNIAQDLMGLHRQQQKLVRVEAGNTHGH